MIVHGGLVDETKLVLGERKFNHWEGANHLVREYDRESIIFFFESGCLGNAESRKALLETKFIFNAKINLEVRHRD